MIRTIALLLLLSTPVLAAEVELPIQINERDRAVTIEAEINGKTRTMVVDTNAPVSVISGKLLRVAPVTLRKGRIRSGNEDLKGVWRDVYVSVGDLQPESLQVGAIDLTSLPTRYDRTVDGVLGQDYFRKFSKVTVDLERKKLILSR